MMDECQAATQPIAMLLQDELALLKQSTSELQQILESDSKEIDLASVYRIHGDILRKLIADDALIEGYAADNQDAVSVNLERPGNTADINTAPKADSRRVPQSKTGAAQRQSLAMNTAGIRTQNEPLQGRRPVPLQSKRASKAPPTIRLVAGINGVAVQ